MACGQQLDRSQYTHRQDRLDDLVQIAMPSVALSLDAEAPVDDVWGRGHTQVCKFESGKVGYVVDTMVSYYGIDNERAATLIKASMQKVGITVSSKTEGGVIRGEKDSFTIDATPTGTVTDPAGMSISFSTDCLNVGQNLAGELAGESLREVPVVS